LRAKNCFLPTQTPALTHAHLFFLSLACDCQRARTSSACVSCALPACPNEDLLPPAPKKTETVGFLAKAHCRAHTHLWNAQPNPISQTPQRQPQQLPCPSPPTQHCTAPTNDCRLVHHAGSCNKQQSMAEVQQQQTEK
jgi:hypothetical protein